MAFCDFTDYYTIFVHIFFWSLFSVSRAHIYLRSRIEQFSVSYMSLIFSNSINFFRFHRLWVLKTVLLLQIMIRLLFRLYSMHFACWLLLISIFIVYFSICWSFSVYWISVEHSHRLNLILLRLTQVSINKYIHRFCICLFISMADRILHRHAIPGLLKLDEWK